MRTEEQGNDWPDGPVVPLLGGDVTEGVVRIADTVRRPAGPHSRLVRDTLAHLESAGFAGAPRYLGVDQHGRDVLSYLSGEVAGRPWPGWVADDDRIASVARLVRAYDDAIAPLGVPDYVTIPPDQPGMPPTLGLPRSFIGHRDVTPENTVFTDGIATALIDFDLARPSHRVDEVCNVLLWWAPLMPAGDREAALADVDPFDRARTIVTAYGLPAADRALLLPVAENQAARTWFTMRDRAERLGGGWRRMWQDGIGDRILRRQSWLAENRDRLAAAFR